MGFWSNLFGKKEREQVENNYNYPIDSNGFINIPREDGTVLQIMPLMTGDGKQQYQSIVDQKTKEEISIPRYRVCIENEYGGIQGHNILMELPAEALQDPQYAEYIANNMLGQKNMLQVVDYQGGYAGGVQTRDGEIVRTVYRPGIIDGLTQTQNNNIQWDIRTLPPNEYREACQKEEDKHLGGQIEIGNVQKLNPNMVDLMHYGGKGSSGGPDR
ncbi:MAG: hypothetical protein E7314_02080 [Clostridiales bacterium]|nr:hypothetical protein [Clostridiales bacterium]